MLRQRIITAVVLLLVLLPALFYPRPEPFCALAALFIAAAAWEWSKLAGFGGTVSLGAAAVCALTCAAVWAAGVLDQRLHWLWAVAALVWVVGGALMLKGGRVSWLGLPRTVRLAVGLLMLVIAWMAVAQARITGVNFLLSILLLVWVADIFAYFAGRTWGGRFAHGKLAPTISPNKSWEGVWGAMTGVVLLALAWRWADRVWPPVAPSLYGQVLEGGRWYMLIAVLCLVGISVVGDLVESLVKRAAAVKDSSNLLPGHGGVLDRLDALLPTLPLAMLLYHL